MKLQRRCLHLSLALCQLMLCVHPMVVEAKVASIERAGSLEQMARRALPKQAELQHQVVAVSLGMREKAVVVLYKASRDSTNFKGMVLIPDSVTNRMTITHLPDMREAEGLFDCEPISVFTFQKESQRALIVLYRYVQLGTGDGAKAAGYAYELQNDEWRVNDKLTQVLVGATNAAMAKQRLSAVQ